MFKKHCNECGTRVCQIIESNSTQVLRRLAVPAIPWIPMRQQKIDKKHVQNIGPQQKLSLLRVFELVLSSSWDICIMRVIVPCWFIIRIADSGRRARILRRMTQARASPNSENGFQIEFHGHVPPHSAVVSTQWGRWRASELREKSKRDRHNCRPPHDHHAGPLLGIRQQKQKI